MNSMERSQWYMGVPNGVVLCVDRMKGGEPAGRFYHAYSREGTVFENMDKALAGMEALYDRLKFPYPATNPRSFTGQRRKAENGQERTRIMRDEELLNMHGDLGTFLVRVQHRQNSSWQGRVTWMEENKTVNFRSVWEMIKLVEEALDTVSEQEGNPREARWPEEEDHPERGL